MYLHESTKDTQIHNLEHPLTAIRKSDASARDWNIEFLTILRGIVYFQNACSTFSGICLSLSSEKAAKIRIIAAELNHFYCRPEVPFSHMRASVAANPWPRAFAVCISVVAVRQVLVYQWRPRMGPEYLKSTILDILSGKGSLSCLYCQSSP